MPPRTKTGRSLIAATAQTRESDEIDLPITLWFGILVAVNLQTAWLSPPVALSAYFLKGVAPQWQLSDIYKGMMQFMVLQLLGLVVLMMLPQLALWLPGVLYTR